jgi:O-antigen/teichoic acid export membrane protein
MGLGTPLLFALASIPVLVQALGPERFGLLTMIWAVTSYFSLFDLGLSRALTQQLAIVLDKKIDSEVGPLCGTALLLMSAIGVLGGALMIGLAPLGVDLIKEMPNRSEAVNATLVMGLVVPIIVLTAGLRGMLEACHAFEVINYIRIPMGLWTFLGPLLVVEFLEADLVLITVALAFGRLLAAFVHAWATWSLLPQLRGRLRPQRSWLSPLLNSGGWLTLSNVVSPFMGYVDRFMVGAVISSAAVAYYATPQEIVTKLWIVPGALTAVLFPAFAAQVAKQNGSSWRLYDSAVALLFVVLLPVTVSLALFSHELLSVWLGPAFAQESSVILQIFSVGILINCLAHVPLTWLHGAGYFKTPALLHCLELPLFLSALWTFSAYWGLKGVALAWLLRMVIDAISLFLLVHRERLREQNPEEIPRSGMWICFALLVSLLAFFCVFESSLMLRGVWASIVFIVTFNMALRLYKNIRFDL